MALGHFSAKVLLPYAAGDTFVRDVKGLDLHDAEAAQSAGARALHDLREELAEGGISDWTLEIADASGAVIVHLSMGELLPLTPPVSKPKDQRPKVLSH